LDLQLPDLFLLFMGQHIGQKAIHVQGLAHAPGYPLIIAGEQQVPDAVFF
jgi:hypothetical protein